MFTCSVQKVPQGTPATITKVKHFLGVRLHAAAATSKVSVYAGDANSDPEIAVASAAVSGDGADCFPPYPVPVDHGAPKNSLYVEVTGASSYALVYYSPTHG